MVALDWQVFYVYSMEMKLLAQIRKELSRARNSLKAKQMQAYMKSDMPYHGVPSPSAKAIFKKIFAEVEFSSYSEWENEVKNIWTNAKFREERYAALNLCGHKCSLKFQTPKALALYEEFIVSGAWWDYVDDIAIHRVGQILLTHPQIVKKNMRLWSRSENIWKRRTSIICQVGVRENIDLKLLYDCIEPSISSNEFFLRKGIGWALRQVAWSNPKEIKRYVKENRDRLSPLSQREALKNLN